MFGHSKLIRQLQSPWIINSTLLWSLVQALVTGVTRAWLMPVEVEAPVGGWDPGRSLPDWRGSSPVKRDIMERKWIYSTWRRAPPVGGITTNLYF